MSAIAQQVRSPGSRTCGWLLATSTAGMGWPALDVVAAVAAEDRVGIAVTVALHQAWIAWYLDARAGNTSSRPMPAVRRRSRSVATRSRCPPDASIRRDNAWWSSAAVRSS